MLGDLIFIGTGTVLGRLFYDHFFGPDRDRDRARGTFRPDAPRAPADDASWRTPRCGRHKWGPPAATGASRIPVDVVQARFSS